MTTWTEKTQQAEVWVSEDPPMRAFDPAAFENNPVFDTGSPAGVYTERSKQSETWTEI